MTIRAIWLPLAAVVSLSFAASAEIYPSPDEIRPLLPGAKVPEFVVFDLEGEPFRVKPDAMEKPVVLTFYRGGWCPYCNMHLAELRKAEAELKQLGFEVWFLSPDRPELLAEGDDAGFGYTLLSDAELSAAQIFGTAFRLDDDTHERYLGFGVDLNARSGNRHRALPAPATFLIGTDGVVHFSYVNPDYTVRLSPEVLLAAARAYNEGAHRRLKRDG